MSAHTPEPWKVEPLHSVVITDSEGGYFTTHTTEYPIGDAARIVACVNYCKGYDRLPDTSLAALEASYKSVTENLYQFIDSLEAQRDELLSAIKMTESNLASMIAAGQNREGSGESHSLAPWLAYVRETIAKVQP